jgi:hypothetical protein
LPTASARWPGPEFHVTAEFRAPIEYVFAWCTDYRPDDARREHDSYDRRIVSRAPDQVVYEDLGDQDDGGWWWARHTVTLRPPNWWHSDSVGSHREVSLDYRLTALGPERTRLDLTWRRRPTALGAPKVSKRALERSTTAAWVHFAAALERDYRAHRPARGR